MHGALEYATDLFDRASVEALAGRLIRLLEAAVGDPDQAIGRLDILSAAERHTILRVWNDTAHPIPPATLPELFEAQVTRTPDAIAVVFEEESLSYAELNARANQLAHHLRSLGVGPEVVVGLCVERSLDMLVGLLGILKAGGAYLPLDPSYPPERLAFMLADADAPVLVTHSALLDRLPAHRAQVVRLDDRLAGHRTPADDRSHAPPSPAKPRLRHLHFRFYRYAKRCRGYSPECRQALWCNRRIVPLWRRRCLDFVPRLCLRLLGLGNLGITSLWRPASGGSPPCYSRACGVLRSCSRARV